jgi:hypothetical protein
MIPRAVVERLMQADSPGHMYVTEIRGRFSEQRLP